MLSTFAHPALAAATQSATQTAISPFGGALTSDAFPAGAESFASVLSGAAGIAQPSPATLAPTGLGAGVSAGAISTSAPFSDLLVQSVQQVDQLERTARSSIEGLISGKGVDVHEAMVATEKAEMGFDMAVAVRDKALAAYQQVMSMQF